MTTFTKDGIEFAEFNQTEENFIMETMSDGSVEAYEDLFKDLLGLELYFRKVTTRKGKNTYQPLPRLMIPLNMPPEFSAVN